MLKGSKDIVEPHQLLASLVVFILCVFVRPKPTPRFQLVHLCEGHI